MSTLRSKNNSKPSSPKGYVCKTGVLTVPLSKVICSFLPYSKSSHKIYEWLIICIFIKSC